MQHIAIVVDVSRVPHYVRCQIRSFECMSSSIMLRILVRHNVARSPIFNIHTTTDFECMIGIKERPALETLFGGVLIEQICMDFDHGAYCHYRVCF
jgi:hypothetical protein